MIITVEPELSIHEVKHAATGRWLEILSQQGLPYDSLDGRHHACPKCGGTDRFRLLDAESGAVLCNQCFSEKNGDGLAALQWLIGCDFKDALKIVAQHCGLSQSGQPQPKRDLIEDICRDKKMPIEAFKQFNPTIETRGRKRDKVVRVPVFNEMGNPHSYFDLVVGGKGWFARGKGMAGMFFPSRLPQPGETWLLVEGCKDASALIGLGFNAAGLPNSTLSAKFARLFAGCDIVLVPDLDSAGQTGAQVSGGRLVGIANSVRVARLPGEVVESGGADVRDVLRQADGESLVRQSIESADTWKPRAGEVDASGLPEVLVSLNESSVSDQVVTALGEMRENVVYCRAGSLVDAVPSEDVQNLGQLVIRQLPISILRERITQACRLKFEKESDGEIETSFVVPPRWLIDAVSDRGFYGGKIKNLSGLIESPTLRPDGSVLQVAGYDPATGLIYRPNAQYPKVPEKPTVDDAKKAVDELLETVVDFPFMSPSDSSAWLALVLSMIGRTCVSGCVPLFAITSNIRGSGKSLLVDAASIIAYGRPAARKTFTRDDDELRKVITSVAIESATNVLFDNLELQLGGASLDAALTSEFWSDRILGKSQTTGELPLRTVWCATGNNVSFGSDIARRVLPIRLHSDLESPEERTGFRHSDLLGWIRQERPRLAVCAITILRAYVVAGRPVQPAGVWGSFDNWAELVRGSLVWSGLSDPLLTRETAKDSDDSKTLLSMLITGLSEADPHSAGITTKEIERLVGHRVDETPTCPTLIAAVAEVCGDRFNARRFGRKVRSFVGRTWESKQIKVDSCRGGLIRWTVKEVQPSGGYGGFGECSSPYPMRKSCVSHTDTCDTQLLDIESGEQDQLNPPNQPRMFFE